MATSSDFNRMMMAGGLGAMGGGLANMFSNFRNPADAASPYYDKIPGTMKPYFDPYINSGQGAMNNLNRQYGQLTNNLPGLQAAFRKLMADPSSVMNEIGKGYQASPGFEFQKNQGMTAANNAAAAGGMLGSPEHQQNTAEMVTGLANKDYYDYVDRGMKSYTQGLGGISGLYDRGLTGMEGMNKMGFDASKSLAENLAAALMNRGNLAYEGANAQNQHDAGGLGSFLGGGMSLLPFLLNL
jgi:hypothetical protein